MSARSTTLKLFARSCGAALDHYEANVPYDRTLFQAGVCAHAILQVIGERRPDDYESTADAVVRELTTIGRSFDGIPEPPMPVELAIKGRAIALAYLANNPISETARFEVGYAVDRNWQPTPYGRNAYYLAALDVIDVVEDTDEDGYNTTILIVRDYKSAWPTGDAELDTVQMKGQAAIAVAFHPEATIVRREAVNLRTGRAHSKDLLLDEDGLAEIQRWRKDIDIQIAASEYRDATGKRPASPGACCVGCPYVLSCQPAREFWRQSIGSADPVTVATAFATADAIRQSLFVLAKDAVAESEIEVPGGTVGYHEAEQKSTRKDAFVTIAQAWFTPDDPAKWAAENGKLLGLLAGLGLSTGNVSAVGKRIHPGRGQGKKEGWKEAREAFEAECVTVGTVAKFGIWRDAAAEPDETNEETQGGYDESV